MNQLNALIAGIDTIALLGLIAAAVAVRQRRRQRRQVQVSLDLIDDYRRR